MPNFAPSAYAAQIAACTSLDELCAALRSIETTIDKANLDSLDTTKVDDYIDITSLPTFGPEPRNTEERFSWDATRFFLQTAHDGSNWGIELRSDSEDL